MAVLGCPCKVHSRFRLQCQAERLIRGRPGSSKAECAAVHSRSIPAAQQMQLTIAVLIVFHVSAWFCGLLQAVVTSEGAACQSCFC